MPRVLATEAQSGLDRVRFGDRGDVLGGEGRAQGIAFSCRQRAERRATRGGVGSTGTASAACSRAVAGKARVGASPTAPSFATPLTSTTAAATSGWRIGFRVVGLGRGGDGSADSLECDQGGRFRGLDARPSSIKVRGVGSKAVSARGLTERSEETFFDPKVEIQLRNAGLT